MSQLRKRKRFTSEFVYRGNFYSIFLSDSLDGHIFFKDEIDKAVKSGHRIFVGRLPKEAVNWVTEWTGIPSKVLRWRLMYYDWQAAMDMGYDPASKSHFKEE